MFRDTPCADRVERLFVSHHTVSAILRHVFAKLDVDSRVELTRLARIHEPATHR
jgi:DNA-binding CsgD family transcriptional regulator